MGKPQVFICILLILKGKISKTRPNGAFFFLSPLLHWPADPILNIPQTNFSLRFYIPMAVSGIRDLSIFISDIPNCQYKEQERLNFDKEIGIFPTRYKNEKVRVSFSLHLFVYKSIYIIHILICLHLFLYMWIANFAFLPSCISLRDIIDIRSYVSCS